MFFTGGRKRRVDRVSSLLGRHFGKVEVAGLSVVERQFPFRVRADLQRAVEQLLGEGGARSFGARAEDVLNGISLSELLTSRWLRSARVSPPEYEEVDVGEESPVRCLKVGLWLLERDGCRYAVLLAPAVRCGQTSGLRLQVAAVHGEPGGRVTDSFFKAVEAAVREARCYRGKILSLEQGELYTGRSSGIRVHRLPKVDRAAVVLPTKTLDLLDRNVVQFAQRRRKLSAFGQAAKKGLLFYGPPGTGKSHTIRYLAGELEGHTTLLVTAEQVMLLDEYMALARLLQPSVVVIEDADLIARDRTQMYGAGQEALLNKLLNEMDGLREDADVMFVLTTNRPEALEAALASRPGRVDQAIEFPLPDGACRERLVRLYAQGVELTDGVVRAVVARTERVSAAFIKELMRRSVQFHLEREERAAVDLVDVESALDEMLFSGGTLNVKLLGGDVGENGVGEGTC
jgi:hypothetical protein